MPDKNLDALTWLTRVIPDMMKREMRGREGDEERRAMRVTGVEWSGVE